MDHPLIDLINAKIKTAQDEGAFDDLAGVGKPLPPCDDPDNALIRRAISDSGAEPEFVTLSREMAAMRAELRDEHDRDKRKALMTRMSMMEVRLDLARKAWIR